MSGLFCFDPQLRILEKQMQQPPGYRPRGHGLSVLEEMDWNSSDNYSRIVDYVISKIHMEHLKQRVDEVFHGIEKELIFLNIKHRKDFFSLLLGRKDMILRHTSNYAAAIFLLSADEMLWMKVSGCVLDTGIYFDRVKLGSVSLEQYILFHAAKDVYSGTKHIRLSELIDKELIADDMFRLIVNAFVIEKCGLEIINQEEWDET